MDGCWVIIKYDKNGKTTSEDVYLHCVWGHHSKNNTNANGYYYIHDGIIGDDDYQRDYPNNTFIEGPYNNLKMIIGFEKNI